MQTNTRLDPDLETVLSELNNYPHGRLFDVQQRRNRKSVAKTMAEFDGGPDLLRAINALRSDAVRTMAPLEFQMSERLTEYHGRPPQHGYIYWPANQQQRDLTMTGVGSGKELMGATFGASFSELLDEINPLKRLGAETVTVTGPVTIPGASMNFESHWQTADGQSVAHDTAFTVAIQLSTSKTIMALVTASDRFLRQGGAFARHVVEHGLTRAIISTVVNAIFNGDGTGGTLLGLFNRPGVQTQASSSADYATALALIKKVESASAVLSPTTAGFVMGSDTAGLYRAEEMAAGSGMAMMGYTLAGFPAVVTEQTAQASLCFGDWSQLLILSYGRLQLGVDPFGASNTTQFRAGQVTLRALWDVDMIPMRPDAFCTASGLS